MENQRKITGCERMSIANVQLLALLAAGLLQFALIIGSEGVFRFVDSYAVIPPALFLGTVLAQKMTQQARRQLQLCLFMTTWFIIVQTQHELFGMNTPPVGFFFCIYLLAFPFAALTQDGAQQKGLKMTAAIYLAASLTLVVYTALLLLDCLPNFLKNSVSINGVQLLSNTVFWDGARLNALWHPNTCANIFMIGIAFTIGFSFRAKRVWARCLLLAASVLQFMALALTNSRTAILMTCAIIAGILFFRICKGGWKRLIAGIAAAAVVMIGLFAAAGALFDLHYERMAAQYAAQAAYEAQQAYDEYSSDDEYYAYDEYSSDDEYYAYDEYSSDEEYYAYGEYSSDDEYYAYDEYSSDDEYYAYDEYSSDDGYYAYDEYAYDEYAYDEYAYDEYYAYDEAEYLLELQLQGSSPQGSLSDDLWTLNGRTGIWGAALRAIRDNPSVLIWGTDNPGSLITGYNAFTVWHSHNSWAEVLLSLGLPGFLAALIFSWSAVRSAFAVLFKQNDIFKKSIALLVLSLLAVGVLEPYLFFAHRYSPFFDFAFFLCAGYLTQWRRPQSCETVS